VTSSVARGLASLRRQRIGVTAVEERRADLHRVTQDLFDVDDMARRALGQHWKSLRPGDQDEFVRQFWHMVTQLFVTIVERYAGDNVTAVDETVAGTFARSPVPGRFRARIGSRNRVPSVPERLAMDGLRHRGRWRESGVELAESVQLDHQSVVRGSAPDADADGTIMAAPAAPRRAR
jgi:hypothetical protein